MNPIKTIDLLSPAPRVLLWLIPFFLLSVSQSFAQFTVYDDFPATDTLSNWAVTTTGGPPTLGATLVLDTANSQTDPTVGGSTPSAPNAALTCSSNCVASQPVTMTFTNTGSTTFRNFVAIDAYPQGATNRTINVIVSDGTNSVTATTGDAYFCFSGTEFPGSTCSHSQWNTVFINLIGSGLTSIQTVQFIVQAASSLDSQPIYFDYLRASDTNPAVVSGCITPTPSMTFTPTVPPTATRTPSPTKTPTVTLTQTPTQTPTITLTFTPTVTLTKTVTPTVTLTQTLVPTPTLTQTPVPSSTATTTFTITITPTKTPTLTLVPTSTKTVSSTPTLSPTKTVTQTPTFTITISPTFTETQTPTVTLTRTSTNTPGPTATATPTCPSPLFPNPVDFQAGHRPAQCPGGINCVVFDCLPAGSTLKIYTIALSLVREFDATGTVVTWDGLNGEADPVAAGVYFYTIQDPKGNRTIGKFAVARAKVNP